MLKKLWKPQTWLEVQVYTLLRYHGINEPEEIELINLCKAYRIDSNDKWAQPDRRSSGKTRLAHDLY